MIRRAVPNGPRVATTVGLLVVVAAATDPAAAVVDDLIVVDVAEAAAAEEVDVAEGKRCFQPTSCIAEEVEEPIPDDDDDLDVAATVTFGLIRTVSFLIDLTVVSTLALLLPPVVR
mmetsp:Transcript_3182/g.4577  ORF Transcript_3182/g.4577 Transcript_3182/m.4577 type:complete len:116 (+) Transcript_3182:55-402(+)